ncbi:MAG: GHKL domain-containing protein [Lachnospiraceae bacterium]|nr:GHKL domain-containing protein [Lachnospiraceae bacterium]
MICHIKIGIGKAFLLTLLYFAMSLSVEYVVYFFNDSNGYIKAPDGRWYSIEGIFVILLAKAVVFLCILAIRKRLRGKSMDLLSDTDWIRLMIFPIFTIIIVMVLVSAIRYMETSEQIMLLSVGSFGMLGMNIMVFYIIRDVAERKEQIYESRIFRIQAENRAQMYRSISEGFDRQKRKTHEYKNHIICMQALLEEKQYEKLENYIKRIYGGLDGDGNSIDTNNVIVNAVLNTKYREAQEAGIVFALRINDLSGLGMKDEDVVTVLCNLLDNAIEACRECDGKKIIKLKFVIEDGMVKIGVRNTFQTPVVYEHGEIKTTKTFQKEEHGTGIKNIIEVIEKYGGSYVINNKDGEFYFSIVLPK